MKRSISRFILALLLLPAAAFVVGADSDFTAPLLVPTPVSSDFGRSVSNPVRVDAGPSAADGRRVFADALGIGPEAAGAHTSRDLRLVPLEPSRSTDWWKGWNGFAIKMAVKVGLPLLAVVVAILIGKARRRRESRKTALERYDLLPYESMISMPSNNGTMPVPPWSADGGLSFEWMGGSPASEVLVLFQWKPETALEHKLSFCPESEWNEDDRNQLQKIKTGQFRYVASASLYQMLGSHCPLRILTLERSSVTPVPLFCEWRADARNGRCIHGLYSGSEEEKDVLDFFLRLLTNGKPENMRKIGTVSEGWKRKEDREIALTGKCPNGCKEPETCPTCGSLLVNGMCPNGDPHSYRCPFCGKNLVDGECPDRCETRPLLLHRSPKGQSSVSPFSLEVVEAPVPHNNERCDLPESVVIGRDFRNAAEAYIELRFADATQRGCCSRRYVQLNYLFDKNGVRVTLITTNSIQFAIVNGQRLSGKGDSAVLREGELLELNPGYRLRLVRTESGTETPSA